MLDLSFEEERFGKDNVSQVNMSVRTFFRPEEPRSHDLNHNLLIHYLTKLSIYVIKIT